MMSAPMGPGRAAAATAALESGEAPTSEKNRLGLTVVVLFSLLSRCCILFLFHSFDISDESKHENIIISHVFPTFLLVMAIPIAVQRPPIPWLFVYSLVRLESSIFPAVESVVELILW